jgi:hypothetical protein
MPEGTYGGLLAYPPAQTITTTSINGTVNLWDEPDVHADRRRTACSRRRRTGSRSREDHDGATPGNIGSTR